MQVPSRALTPQSATAPPSAPKPLTRSQSAPSLTTPSSPTRSTPSGGQQARTGEVQAQQALTSPETVQGVGPQASRVGSESLNANGTALADLRGGLMGSISPIVTVSPPPEAPPPPPPPPTAAPATPARGPNLSNVSNIVRPDHVISTHIMGNAQITPEVRQMKAQLRDLDQSVTQLNNRMSACADTINEMSTLPRPLTRDQTATLTDARQQIKSAEHQLTGALTQRHGLQNRIAEATATPPEGHGHVKTVWENTKAAYIENQDSKSDLFMNVAIEFRQRVMDTMVSQAASGVTSPLEAAPRVLTKAVGSTALTSDRDINVTVRDAAIGSDTSLVEKVNTRFRAMFGQDSGTFFDTNLYNEGLMPDMDTLRAGKPVDVWHDPSASRANDSQQDLVAMVKQRRFFTSPEEWASHTDAIATAMSERGASGEQVTAFKNQCSEANTFVVAAEKAVADRVGELRLKFPSSSGPELELMASNELYLEHVKVADQAMRDAGSDEGKIAKARGQMGLAHYFANEAGMSEGVLRDVVINGQEIPGINRGRAEKGQPPLPAMKLSASQLLQSFNENLGDTLKEFNHHGANIGEAAFHGSKYIGRLAKGFLQLAQGKTDPALAPLRSLADKLIRAEGMGLLSLRKNERIGELAAQFGIPNDPANPEATKSAIATVILDRAGLGDLAGVDGLRGAIKQFGQQVNALTRTS